MRNSQLTHMQPDQVAGGGRAGRQHGRLRPLAAPLVGAVLTGAATLGALALLGGTSPKWLLVAAVVTALQATVVLSYRPEVEGAAAARDAPGELVMPDTGFGAHGVLVGWFKRPGQRVAAGEPLATVEVDVAEFTLFAPATGTLAELNAEPGETVAVGQPLAALRPTADETA